MSAVATTTTATLAQDSTLHHRQTMKEKPWSSSPTQYEEEEEEEDEPDGPWYFDIFFLIKVIGNTALAFSLAVLFLSYAPFPPDVEMYQFNAIPSPELKGALAPNELLSAATKVVDDDFPGPECVAVHNGFIYSGLEDGRIIRISSDKRMETIVKVGGEGCEKFRDSVRGCGHPLGIRVDKKGDLFVADSVKGLYKVDTRNGKITTLFNSSQQIDGKQSRFIDDLVISRDGDIYFTDASTKWSFEEAHYNMAELTANGRILHYDPRTGKTSVVIDELPFPNGIELTTNEEALIFAQTSRFNLMRYYLKGPKRGQTDVFVDNLPGVPDNLRRSERGSIWVALPKVRLTDRPTLLEVLCNCPMTRKVVFRLPYFLILPFKFLDYFWPFRLGPFVHGLVDRLFFWIEANYYGLVLEVDPYGNIVRSLHSTTGQVNYVSTALEVNDLLYLGTPYLTNLLQLPLNRTTDTIFHSPRSEL